MAENLNYNATGSKCYKDNSINCDKYGRLYNWSTAMNACPSGWHLPSLAEWKVLSDYVASAAGVASVAGTKLKATSGWYNNGNGTDDYGFSALPGGYGYSGGGFYDVEYYGYWWSASEDNSNDAYFWGMIYDVEGAGWDTYGKSNWYSVRCLQDDGEANR